MSSRGASVERLTRIEQIYVSDAARRLRLEDEFVKKLEENINRFRPYIRGVPGWAKIGGIILYTARELGYPLTIDEVARACNPELTRKRLRRKLIYSVYNKLAGISGLRGVTPRASEILEGIAEKYNIPKSVLKRAKALADRIEREVSSVSRVTIAATSLYLAGRTKRLKYYKQSDVAEMLGTTETSIRNLMRRLREMGRL